VRYLSRMPVPEDQLGEMQDADRLLPDLAWAMDAASQLRSDLDRILGAASQGLVSPALVTDRWAAFTAISHYGVELERLAAVDGGLS
jgi:hypothetical protein